MQIGHRAKHFRRFVAVLAALAACVGLWHARSGAEPAPLGFAEPPAKLRSLGVSTCASTACHYGSGGRGSKGSEYTVWATLDRHARAFRVLLEGPSQTIVRNYKQLGPAEAVHPEKEALCLQCHAGAGVENRDGVGCESCHGPAEKWRTAHYLAEWKQKTTEERNLLGMRPTKELVARATLCVECHVGTAEREVNHDLIAAGHPRLNFEFAAYLANMPAHWREEGENARPDFPARAWAIGQVVSARAALELLESRATGPSKPWPEFAEYDCFACHHDLRDDTRRQKAAFGIRAPGSYPWGTWYYPLLGTVVAEDATALEASLGQLRQTMGRTYPDPKVVVRQAHDLKSRLGSVDATRRVPSIAAMLRQHGSSWDASAQTYLALAALNQASRPDQQIVGQLERLRAMLQFPAGSNGPAHFQPELFHEEVEKLRQHFGK
jgi:hypothetical protein